MVLDEPGAGEVLVRVQASGVCHTDYMYRQGDVDDRFPYLLGHEGAGYVERVGEGVTHLKEGDPVVIAYRAPCRLCPACRTPSRAWSASPS